MSGHFNQIELVAGILKLLDEQNPGLTANPRQYNTIIQAADQIIESFSVGHQGAQPGMGLSAWLMSDDVGASSKFMVRYLTGKSRTDSGPHPSDPGDFGRCRKLLDFRLCEGKACF